MLHDYFFLWKIWPGSLSVLRPSSLYHILLYQPLKNLGSLHPCGCRDTHHRTRHSFQTKNTHSWQQRSVAVTPPQQDITFIGGCCYRLYLDCSSVWEGDSFRVASTSHVSAQGFPAEHQCYSFHPFFNQAYVQTEGIWIIASVAQSNWCWMVIHQTHRCSPIYTFNLSSPKLLQAQITHHISKPYHIRIWRVSSEPFEWDVAWMSSAGFDF